MRENITIYARKMLKVRFVCMLIVCCFFVQSTFYVSTSLSSYCIDENLVVEEGTDFEDQLTWGFAGNANPAIVVEQGNRFLRASVTGQTGSRHATKTFVEPFSDSKVRINFDWRPNTVTTPLNSSEVLFRDSANNPIFRLVKSGGANGAVRYGVGTTGTDLARTVIIDGMSTDNRWLNADISFDFNNGTVSFELYDRENIENRFQMTDLSLIDVNYLSNIASMVISGNRASGQNLAFTTDIDNVRIYSTQTPAPDRPQIKISSISTVYQTNHTVPQGTTELDVISLLPRNLDVLLENGGRRTIPITWDSIDYDRTKIGDYIFESEFNLQGIVAVANPDNVRATVIVSVAYGEPVPQIDGYVNQYFSSFGDQVPVVPANWGFTTSGATLSINNADVAGNMTPKLQFTITNQTGGRNATKIFDPSVGGDVILVKFDWFPGLLNARGGNPHENGGEIRIIGSNNRTIFTINNTRNSPLRYFVGTQTPRETGFVNPEVWFQVEIRINVLHSEVGLKLTCKADQVMYESVSPLDVVDFGGTVNVVTIAGIRTAGNNITWTTFLDDFGIYNIPVPNNRIMSINRLPYHRVYVGETSEDISLLGLPSKVSATLADGSIAYVPVKTWLSKEGDWNPNIRGVYTFTGSIDSTPEFDNVFKRTATLHVYNRYPAPNIQRQVEWLNRGAIALTSDEGIFISWRLRADEFKENIKFDLLRNGNSVKAKP